MCIVCYGYDIPVLLWKQPAAKLFYSLFIPENHFPLATIHARRVVKVGAIIIPFVT